MSDTETLDMIHEDALPGHESELEPKPDWAPLYPGSGRLEGKVALITGADSGIGRAVAALFAREGADIAILYLCEHDDAKKTKEIVEGEGRKAIAIAGDVGDKAFCERAVKETVDKLGRLDILVNNAAEQHPDEEITDVTEEQLKRTFQTNFYGYFFMVQAARPHLKNGAAIINCTSVTMYKGSEAPARLFGDQGRDHRLHPLAFAESDRRRNPGQRGRAGADLDSAEPVRRPAAGEDPRFRQGRADGPPRPAQRGRAELPVPRLRGFELHGRTGAPPQWGNGGQRLTRPPAARRRGKPESEVGEQSAAARRAGGRAARAAAAWTSAPSGPSASSKA